MKYTVEFFQGKWTALRNSEKLTSGEYFDGKTGSFNISKSDKAGNDFRKRGRLQILPLKVANA